MMYLLQSAITVDVNELPIPHIIAIVITVAIIFANGIRLKIGSKEILIGGILGYLSKKDEDILVRERLKDQTGGIDNEMLADLYDLIGSLDGRLQRILLNKHCWFTLENFANLIKRELEQRVRINNLKYKLCEDNRISYTAKILSKVKEGYSLLQAKAGEASCNDIYSDFSEIQAEAAESIGVFFDGARIILIKHMKRKIELYEKTKSEFKTNSLRKSSIDIPVEKNKSYIAKLGGTA